MPDQFARTLLLRQPLYTIDDYQYGPENSLNDPVFRAAIYVASPGFYGRLSAADFSWNKLSPKEQGTVFKYYNRACFRSTPFGLFASVSAVNWSEASHDTAIFLQPQILHLQADQSFVQAVSDQLAANGCFEPNPTLYRVMKDYRFISTEVNDGKRNYQLQSTDYSQVLEMLLNFCRTGRPAIDITQRIAELARTSLADAGDHFSFLCDAQVLLPVNRMRLTGKGYLKELFELQQITQIQLPSFDEYIPLKQRGVKTLKAFEEKITKAFNVQAERKPLTLVTDYRVLENGRLSSQYQQTISEGVDALRILAPLDANTPMVQFARRFRQCFEGQHIPLLHALDPEAGVGYDLHDRENQTSLLETIQVLPLRETSNQKEFTAVSTLLMKKWLEAERNNLPIISLTSEDLESLGTVTKKSAQGISVLFRLAGDQVYIESAGGNNLLGLAGRFTHDTEIYRGAKTIAETIEAQNPAFIFAELLHLSDPHIDNVNLRQAVWTYELALTAGASLPPAQQVHLTDLYVVLEGESVYLWSQRHQKFVVPRLTTAYNHSLNQLPIFRFLADLPYQYGQSNFSFSLHHYFPGLPYYPRVAFKNAILSPATWIIKDSALTEFRLAAQSGDVGQFMKLAAQLRLPEIFVFGEGDQQLVFHSSKALEVQHLAEMIGSASEITLKEWLLVTTEEAAHNRFADQWNCYILPQEPLAVPLIKPLISKAPNSKRHFLPGSQWLYLKLYVPKRKVNQLLLMIEPLLRKKFAHGGVEDWFFVRYEDHGPHLRLRLKISPEDVADIMQAFRKRLDGHFQQHLIREYQVDVYSRELERYAPGGIELTEQFFCSGSRLVMNYLKSEKKSQALPIYLVAAVTVKTLADVLLPAQIQQKDFFYRCYQDMFKEFEGKDIKYQLDLKFRSLAAELRSALGNAAYLNGSNLEADVKKLTDTAALIKDRLAEDQANTNYLHSLFHMHLNRFFSDDARLQEMVIYYLLYKYLGGVEGRRKAAAG